MRNVYLWIVTIIMVMFASSLNADTLASMNNKQEAENVLRDYFNLLAAGSTSNALELLTGPMLKSNENLLKNNPDYRNFIKVRYTNASIAFSSFKIVDATKSRIDVLIRLSGDEEMASRFTLAIENDRLKIYSEEELKIP